METKKHRSFRLNESTIDQIGILQKIYTEQLGVKVSQAEVLQRLVKAEYNSIDPNHKR